MLLMRNADVHPPASFVSTLSEVRLMRLRAIKTRPLRSSACNEIMLCSLSL